MTATSGSPSSFAATVLAPAIVATMHGRYDRATPSADAVPGRHPPGTAGRAAALKFGPAGDAIALMCPVPRSWLPCAALLLGLLAPCAGAGETSGATLPSQLRPAVDFARARAADGYEILLGPSPPQAPSVAAADCAALYARRLELTRAGLDYRPTFWRDPRHAGAVFVGAIWTPAFYYLPYRAVAELATRGDAAARLAELDALRHAAATQRCFER